MYSGKHSTAAIITATLATYYVHRLFYYVRLILDRPHSTGLAGVPPAVPPVAHRPGPVAAGPPLEAHALPLRGVAAPVPRALRVELRPLGRLVDLDGHRTRGVGGHVGGGEEGEVSELRLEEDERRLAAGGGAAEQGGVMGVAVVSIHGNLRGRGGAGGDDHREERKHDECVSN